MERRILRLLLVDNSPDDAEFAVAALRKAGYKLKSQLVPDLAGFQATFDKGEWDAVLTEFALPHFNAQFVIDHIKHSGLDLPVLVLTRAIADADFARIMQFGARDVVLKDHLARLAPAMERELRAVDERRAYRDAIQTLKEMEAKHRAVVDQSNEAIGYLQDGMHVDANKVYLDVFQYGDAKSLEGIPVMNLIEKSDQARFKDYLRRPNDPKFSGPQEFTALRQDGVKIHVQIALSMVVIDGQDCAQILVTDISRRKAVETKLQYLHQHDALTGLYNRQYFAQMVGNAVERARADGPTSGIVYLDLYQLKDVTNNLGHAVGDRLLLNIVRVLRATFGDGALLARFRDNEFAALLDNIDAVRLKEIELKLQNNLKASPFKEDNKTVACEFYLVRTLIDRNAGGAREVLATLFAEIETRRPAAPAIAEPAAAQQPRKFQSDWRERIQAALQKNLFQLSYQPIVNLHGEAAEYYEVLVRMSGRNGELIPASEFMPPAEASGQSIEIDRWVIHESIRALAELHREGRGARFFLNLSPTAPADDQLLALLAQWLAENKMASRHLVFELDEAAVLGNYDPTVVFARALRTLGAGIGIDNFGKTLGEIERLRELKAEFLILEGGLVRDLRGGDNQSQVAIAAALEMAKASNAKTIAKSVESATVLSFLWRLGVEYAQGDYFQQADAEIDYDFGGETTLSSETLAPQWASGSNRKKPH